MRSICTNHFGRKCYSYIYPRVTTTVETEEQEDRETKLEKQAFFEEEAELNTERALTLVYQQ